MGDGVYRVYVEASYILEAVPAEQVNERLCGHKLVIDKGPEVLDSRHDAGLSRSSLSIWGASL